MAIEPGKEWARPADGPVEALVASDDAALALVVAQQPGLLVQYSPTGDSSIARTLGWGRDPGSDRTSADPETRTEVAMDALRLGDGRLAVATIVLGSPPGARWGGRRRRVTLGSGSDTGAGFAARGVVIANTQWLGPWNVAPRGHPGDGRCELLVDGVPWRERAELRRRLRTGTHLPHPLLMARTSRRFTIRIDGPWPIFLDGVAAEATVPPGLVEVEIVPAAYRLAL